MLEIECSERFEENNYEQCGKTKADSIRNGRNGRNRTKKLTTKDLGRKIKKTPKENPFYFTDLVEMQKEENKKDICILFELAEENKIIYNQVAVNSLIEAMEKLKNAFFTNRYFPLCDQGEVKSNRLFRDSSELAKLMSKILDKYDDRPNK